MFAHVDGYEGSTLFQWVAEATGFPVDLINFLLTQAVAWAAASALRTSSAASPLARHLVCLTLGVLCGHFCFGPKAVHLAAMPALCYLIVHVAPHHLIGNSVLAAAIAYLSCIHLHRQFYLHDSYNLDLTGPLMVITQRVTSLAYSIQDGQTEKVKKGLRPVENGTAKGDDEVLSEPPSLLEFFSYTLAFQTLLCGPALSYSLYMDFIHGRQHPMQEKDEPSRRRAVAIKVCVVVLAAILHLVLSERFPLSNLSGDEKPDWSAAYLLWFCYMATLAARCKYYLAWLLADVVCNSSGIGYNPPGKWDKVTNVDIIGFETAPTFRDAVAHWNPGTNAWLRNIVYNRVKSAQLFKTYALSAIWHGFYPGYYLTFGTGALFTLAARKVRRFTQQFAWSGGKLYGALAFMLTRVFMTYATVPFVLLDFAPSFALYKRVYFCLHWVAIGALLLPSPKSSKKLTTSTANGETKHENGKLKAG